MFILDVTIIKSNSHMHSPGLFIMVDESTDNFKFLNTLFTILNTFKNTLCQVIIKAKGCASLI